MKKQSCFQNNLSVQSPILLDEQYKQPKVDKMLAVLQDCGILCQKKGCALDIGCSAGFFTRALSPFFNCVYGLDIDENALAIASKKSSANNITYILGNSEILPFDDNTIDLIICNHVYEHVPDARKLFKEIERILSDRGVCYLGAASRLIIMEPHYHLPFLSWLPKIIAHRYMKAMGKGSYYYENLRTYWGIRSLIANFDTTDYTLKIIRDPESFSARDMIPSASWIEKIPIIVWKWLYPLFPSYILVLRKNLRFK